MGGGDRPFGFGLTIFFCFFTGGFFAAIFLGLGLPTARAFVRVDALALVVVLFAAALGLVALFSAGVSAAFAGICTRELVRNERDWLVDSPKATRETAGAAYTRAVVVLSTLRESRATRRLGRSNMRGLE